MIPLRDVIPSRTTPYVTIALIVVNVARVPLSADDGRGGSSEFVLDFGLIPAHFSWVAVLTSMFLHGGLLHFGGNMLYLWIFGDNVEDRMGHGRFLAFYLLCGIGAGAGPDASSVPTRSCRWSAPAARSPGSWALTSCSTRTRGS